MIYTMVYIIYTIYDHISIYDHYMTRMVKSLSKIISIYTMIIILR